MRRCSVDGHVCLPGTILLFFVLLPSPLRIDFQFQAGAATDTWSLGGSCA
jgi:hypothetical protein